MKRSLVCLILMYGFPVIGIDMPVYYDEIVVTGEKVEETATVEIVTAEEIRKQGAVTLADALEMVPGVYVRVGGKGEANVRIRGFRQREVAILINGVPANSSYYGALDLSRLPAAMIERIEIVKGPGSLLYGSNAMGGVVNVITSKSDGKQKYRFKGEYGSGDALNLSGMVQGGVGNIRYLVSGGYMDRDKFPLSDNYEDQPNQDTGDRANSDRENWNMLGSLGFDIGETGTMTFSLGNMESEKGLPHHESDSKAKYRRCTDWSKLSADTIYEQDFSDWNIKAKLYYDELFNVLDGYDDATYSTQDDKKNGFTNTYKEYSLGGDIYLRYHAYETHLFKFALRPHHDVHDEQADFGEPWESYDADTISAAMENEWQPLDSLSVVYGLSFDAMRFDKTDGGSRNIDSINPQAAVLWQSSETLQFRASIARKSRFPILRELYSSTSGNPDLDPMTSMIYEVGIEWMPVNNLRTTLVCYYYDVKDMISRDRSDDPYINVDKAVFSGIETGVKYMSGRFDLAGSYVYLDAEDKTSEDYRYIEHRPEHKLDLTAGIKLPVGFRVDVTGQHVSEQTYFDDGEQKLDAFSLFGLRVSKTFGSSLELYLTVKNITDELYYEREGYPREGRTFFSCISINL